MMRTSLSRAGFALLLPLAVFAISLAGCSKQEKVDPSKSFAMGSPVSVGPFTYVVTESVWLESLDGNEGRRLPQDRFLSLSLSISNHGDAEAYVPMLRLVDAKGNEYPELTKGDGFPQWLGIMRPLAPSQSESGQILFDVRPGEYSLIVSSGGDAEKEITSRVIIPLRADVPNVKGPDPLQANTPTAK